MSIFCSTIIPTVNRSTLTRTVFSVLDQSFSEAQYEVIVVNDSGRRLPGMAWQESKRVHVIETQCRERSVARNTGAAIARGKYLHFLDDDDLLLPGALETFWSLDRATEDDVVWLYGSYQTVDNDDVLVEQIHPGITGDIFALLVAGESIPFQASLLRSQAFHAAGGFDPNPDLIGVEDRDVGRRVALDGMVAYVPFIVAQIRIGERGSTTDWGTIAEGDRRGREKALSSQNAFARLRRSGNSAYWHGRISRAYFASAVWNLKRKNIFMAASRTVCGLAFTGWHTASSEYWRGLRTRVN